MNPSSSIGLDASSGIFPTYNTITNKAIILKSVSSTESNLLEKLYSLSKILFTEEFINTLFKIYDHDEFNILNLNYLHELSKCAMFVDYMKNDDEERNKHYDKLFNIYFNALSNTRLNNNAVVFKNKICSILKMTLKINSFKSGISLKNINVNISTTYKPSENNNITATCDIVNVIKEGFFKSIDPSNIEMFSYVPQVANVVVQGPILKNVINGILNLQTQLIQAGNAHGMKVEPFIENTHKKMIL
ncbi:CmNV_097-like protein [Aratus pisonii nudivirus]|nr:CmNV_097-like protein [Aratus pisonii nudivirus]